jgi:hypothetical protein
MRYESDIFEEGMRRRVAKERVCWFEVYVFPKYVMKMYDWDERRVMSRCKFGRRSQS